MNVFGDIEQNSDHLKTVFGLVFFKRNYLGFDLPSYIYFYPLYTFKRLYLST